MSSAEGLISSEAAPTELNMPFNQLAHRVAKSAHLFRRFSKASCSFVFLSVSALTFASSSLVSWLKRRELLSKIHRASSSSSLNLAFRDCASTREPSAVCSRMSFSFREASSSFILSSKPLTMTSFFYP
jgi:hypothetical protein